jgi:hypothetical protein
VGKPAIKQVVRDKEIESAVAAGIPHSLGIEAEVYDSGASCHVSPFRDKFILSDDTTMSYRCYGQESFLRCRCGVPGSG